MERRCAHRILIGNPEGKKPVRIDGQMIFKWTLKK
jgi:hypothetical protein